MTFSKLLSAHARLRSLQQGAVSYRKICGLNLAHTEVFSLRQPNYCSLHRLIEDEIGGFRKKRVIFLAPEDPVSQTLTPSIGYAVSTVNEAPFSKYPGLASSQRMSQDFRSMDKVFLACHNDYY